MVNWEVKPASSFITHPPLINSSCPLFTSCLTMAWVSASCWFHQRQKKPYIITHFNYAIWTITYKSSPSQHRWIFCPDSFVARSPQSRSCTEQRLVEYHFDLRNNTDQQFLTNRCHRENAGQDERWVGRVSWPGSSTYINLHAYH